MFLFSGVDRRQGLGEEAAETTFAAAVAATVLAWTIQCMVLPYMFGRPNGDILGEVAPVSRFVD